VLLAPAVVARKGTYLDVFTSAARAGITRAIADGTVVSTDNPPRLKKTQEHSIDLVVFEGKLATLERAPSIARSRSGRGRSRCSAPAAARRPCSPRAAPARAAGRASRSWIRAGSRSTPSRGAARPARAPASRAAPRRWPRRSSPSLARACERLAPLAAAARRAPRGRALPRGLGALGERRGQVGETASFLGRSRDHRRRPAARAHEPPRLRRPGGPRLPGSRSPRRHALRRRDAAPPPRGAARQRAHRRALRARRAHDRPAPARHHEAAPQPPPPRRHGEHRAHGRARRGHHPRGRSPDRSRPRGRPKWRADRGRRAAFAGALRSELTHRQGPRGGALHRPLARLSRRRGGADRAARRARPQPAR
jgi:hypothetical protein